MRILFLDQFSTLGGAQQCLLDLAPALIARGWAVHAGIPGIGPLAAKLTAAGVTVHEIPLATYTNGRKEIADVMRFAREMPALAMTIRRLIEDHDIDLTFVNAPRVLPAAAMAATTIVFHAHSRLVPGYARFLAGNSLRVRCAVAIAASHFTARPLEPYLPASRIKVVYSGVPDHGPAIPPTLGIAPVIGIIGRIAPEKGQSDFVRAARSLARTMPECRFVVCGDAQHSAPAYFERVRAEARDLPVVFKGWREDIGRVLHSVNVLAVPSTAVDAAPRVIMEAFSAGVPVVAYPSGGIPELIDNGQNGILTAAPSPELLAAEIGALLRSPERIEFLRSNARRTYEQRFTLERYRADVLAVLEQIASGERGKRRVGEGAALQPPQGQ
jgi:glycosyltransferase involved in cell wall biosynthesis